ncbi:MOSC domain-containing protein [Streptomyces somaliensis]|uniref:MOSC domain-containing protein n=1 Tax=Streptomyces somaliensis TaxID=78355 RepID=UPI0020CEC0FB|nr:MOSC N-terminal beta barrel domain-containing protein [Streptomyces somaliensis]MCP9946735.1 MOSC domain-containing protein [Streptomyces somaliensis]MCP9963685.1 MOSC domain-containing protein [Streptomyces somaliensis]MCP9972901.1 MOSC domain-containing protein [Streptomyces somaliensis]
MPSDEVTSQPVLGSLHVHPVKALGGFAPARAVVEPWGLAGDRRWMIADRDGKAVTQRQHPVLAPASAEPLPGGGVRVSAPGRAPLDVPVPDPAGGTVVVDVFGTKVEAVPAGPEPDAWFGDYLGADVRLVHMDEPARRRPLAPDHARAGETVSFADGFPLLVTTTASLDALNALVAAGDHADEGPLPMERFRPNAVVDGTAAWEEDRWARIAVGEVVFRVAKPCGRCVVTTVDQRTGVRGREPLRTLSRHRGSGGRVLFGQNLVPESTGTLRVGDPVRVLATRDA